MLTSHYEIRKRMLLHHDAVLGIVGDREFGSTPAWLAKGASAMAHYRAYLVGQDSYFIKAVDLDCDDDAAAIKRAQKMVDGHDVELWQHARRIAKFDHGSK